MPSSRRDYLAALAASSGLALAGCSNDGTTTESPSPSTAAPTPTPTDTPTVTLTETPPPTPTATTTTAPETTTTPTATTTTPAIDPEALQSQSEAYAQALAAGEFQAVVEEYAYTEQVAAQIDADSLGAAWTQQTGDLGTFTGLGETQSATQQGYYIVVVAVRYTGGEQPVRLVYDGQGRIAGLQFPQPPQQAWTAPDYADESAFSETEISLEATGGCTLGGTLTLPEGDGQVPGVVLVHGSGPNDRDETIGPNKPFKDLAWGLATQGIAVMRYDKRTATCQVDPATLTIDEEVTTDALTAVARLRDHDRVSDVVVAGHSLGGMVAPRIAARDDDLAGLIMLAAPARSLWDLFLYQTRYLAELDGNVTATEQQRINAVEQAVQRIENLNIASGETVLGGGRPYWESLQAYDQVAVAQDLSLPRLLVQGGRDYQVTADEDFQQWRDALDSDAAVSFELYPQLNHILVAGEGQPNPEEYNEPGNVDGTLVADLATWIGDNSSA